MGDVEFVPPDLGMPIEHVIDRHGYVWRLVRDGGMATRAHYAGLVSIGIAALEREHGPLVTLAEHTQAARAEGGIAALEEAARDMRRNPLGLTVAECADVLDERAAALRSQGAEGAGDGEGGG